MMRDMEKKDIVHLASLARIRISDEEAEALKTEIGSVLEYVSAVDAITADTALTKKVGPVFNVLREDVIVHEGGTQTEVLLDEAPKRKGRYVQVKKILQQD